MYGLDRNDAEDIALKCLCRAAYLFNERLGFKFVTYAWKAVCSELNRFLHQQASRPRMRTGFLFVEDENTSSPALDPADEHSLPAETQAEIAEKIACLKAVLTQPLFETLWEYHVKERTTTEIAQLLGISRQAVKGRLRRATEVARRRLFQFVEGEPITKQRQSGG
jgi:RNA polymerase sigma factor (sigma-70 family)